MATIREEGPGDEAAIHAVVAAAFSREAEATLVDEVRDLGLALLSLVALVPGHGVVGHVLFTAATVGPSSAALLGPLSVHPRHQRGGLGGRLVLEGVARVAALGVASVVLVGSPLYYARFGFVPGARFGVTTPTGEHDELVMALELRPKALVAGGAISWHALFDHAGFDHPGLDHR